MMAKQFVTEIHQENSVVILVNGVDAKRYHRNPTEFEGYNNPLVAGCGEYEEVTEGNKVHYWVWVPDLVPAGKEITKTKVLSSKELKKKKKYELIAKKNERIERYAQMFKETGEIIPTEDDLKDAVNLASIQNRKIKDRKFIMKLLRSANSPVSMIAGEDIYDEEYLPDEDVGIAKKYMEINPNSKLTMNKIREMTWG